MWHLCDIYVSRRHWLLSLHVGPVFRRLAAEGNALLESNILLSTLHALISFIQSGALFASPRHATLECVACYS